MLDPPQWLVVLLVAFEQLILTSPLEDLVANWHDH